MQPSPSDLVTVVIPVLNGSDEDWLKLAINSFPTGTRVIVAENDGELAAALNAAIEEVDTEWMVVFGADDAAFEGFIEEMLSVSWNADVVYPSTVMFGEDLKEILNIYPAEMFCKNRLKFHNFVPHPSLIKTEWMRRVGGYNDLPYFEDWDLFVRLSEAGARFKPCPDAHFAYRRRDTSRNREGEKNLFDFKNRFDLPEIKATFYCQGTAATTYLRCILPARHLPGIATTALNIFADDDYNIQPGCHLGTAVLQYPGDQHRAAALVVLKKNNIRVLVEVDDNYVDYNKEFLAKANWDEKIGQQGGSGHSIQGHRWIVKHADGVIVTNEELARRYKKFNENVYVIPNCVDPDDWKFPEQETDGVYRIGWFASASHVGDERLIKSACEWFSKQENSQAVFMGYVPDFQFPHLKLPWSNDLDMYRLLMHGLNIGLCPIITRKTAMFRSDIKASEYAMAGALPIVSDVPSYSDWKHGEICLKAKTAKDFLNHTKWCYQNKDEVAEMAQAAKEWVLENRNVVKLIDKWREAIDGTNQQRASGGEGKSSASIGKTWPGVASGVHS